MLSQLARIVLAGETLDSILSNVVQLTKQGDPGRRRGVVDSGAQGAGGDGGVHERQYGLDNGPCLDAGPGGEILHISDVRSDDRWPDYAPQAVRAGVLSSLSIPLPIREDLARVGLSPDDAFNLLVKASQRENRKLRDVAQDVVERAQQRRPGQ